MCKRSHIRSVSFYYSSIVALFVNEVILVFAHYFQFVLTLQTVTSIARTHSLHTHTLSVKQKKYQRYLTVTEKSSHKVNNTQQQNKQQNTLILWQTSVFMWTLLAVVPPDQSPDLVAGSRKQKQNQSRWINVRFLFSSCGGKGLWLVCPL